MTWQTYQLTALANLGFCLCILWACICRLNSDLCKEFLRPRMRYTALLGGAVANGMQPIFFGTMPGPGETIFSGTVLLYLVLNVPRWKERKSCDPDE